jgi:hypothetical protein
MPLVYTIVLFDQSPAEFRNDTEHYIHFGRMKTDTDIMPNSIVRQVYVTLDIFKQQMQNKPINTELEAWMTLLSSQDLDIIEELLTNFEGFDDIYREIFQLRTNPEELIQMYGNIFYDADRNEDRLILEEMQDKIDGMATTIAERDDALAKCGVAIAARDNAIADLQATIASLQKQLADK